MAAVIGYGMKFGIKSGGTYPDLSEVIEITPNARTRNTVDATHYQSANGYREFIGGLRESGEYSVAIHYVPAVSDALVTAFNSGTATEVQITWPNGIREQAAGVITNLARAAPIEDRLTQTFTLKISGQPTLLVAA